MRNSTHRRIITLTFIAAFVVLFLSGIWLAANRETRTTTYSAPELSQDQITQRALEIARAQYNGAPVQVLATKTTMGESGVINCNPMTGWLAGTLDKIEGKPDWCAADTIVWIIDLRGDFRHGAVVTNALSVAVDGTGKFIRLDTGELTTADSD